MDLINLSRQHPILIYDGVCVLCNAVVKVILRHDKKDQFRFISLQEVPKDLLPPSMNNLNTVVLLDKGAFYDKSTAALKVAQRLGGVFYLFQVFYIVPRFIRDWVYQGVARIRYRVFGKYDACPITPPNMRHKFISL